METFGVKAEDRLSHVYVIGKTGTGKSTLLETTALQDLERGNGFALIDPHGDLRRPHTDCRFILGR
jgi:type IV secretory pathway VirB4 component